MGGEEREQSMQNMQSTSTQSDQQSLGTDQRLPQLTMPACSAAATASAAPNRHITAPGPPV